MRTETRLALELAALADQPNPRMPECERRKLDDAIAVLHRVAAGTYDPKDIA